MAISLVTSIELQILDASAGTNTRTLAHTLGTRVNGCIVTKVLVQNSNAITAISATWNGNAMTKDVEYNPTAAIWLLTFSYPVGTGDASSRNCVVTYTNINTGASLVGHIILEVYDGVLQSAPKDQTNTATGTTNPTCSVTPGFDNELIVSSYITAANTVLVSTNGTITQDYDAGSNCLGGDYKIQSGGSGSPQAMAWSGNGTDTWYEIVVSYKPVVTGAPPTVVINTSTGQTQQTLRPTFLFTGTDAESNRIRYKAQIGDDPTFATGTNIIDFNNTATSAPIHMQPNVTDSTWEGNPQVDDRPGQSCTGKGGVLESISFNMGMDHASVTNGNSYARLYNETHATAFGTDSTPANAATINNTPTPGWLAKSDALAWNSGSGSTDAWRPHVMSGTNRIRLTHDGKYVVQADYVPADRNIDNSPTTQTDTTKAHAGNWYCDGHVLANFALARVGDIDCAFRLTVVQTVIEYISGTATGFSCGGDADLMVSGQQVTFTLPTALSAAGTYYLRVAGIDPDDANVYGDWSSSIAFTVVAGTGGTLTGGLLLDGLTAGRLVA